MSVQEYTIVEVNTFLRLPESSFNGTFRDPGPMLKLRDFFEAFAGEEASFLTIAGATRPSAIFSLPTSEDMAVELVLSNN
jgi:hypothetical protein